MFITFVPVLVIRLENGRLQVGIPVRIQFNSDRRPTGLHEAQDSSGSRLGNLYRFASNPGVN